MSCGAGTGLWLSGPRRASFLSISRRSRYFTATIVSVSSFVSGVENRRAFPPRHTRAKRDRTVDLAWWSERVGRFLSEGREVFAYANNHYQNHSPSTQGRFVEIRRRSR